LIHFYKRSERILGTAPLRKMSSVKQKWFLSVIKLGIFVY